MHDYKLVFGLGHEHDESSPATYVWMYYNWNEPRFAADDDGVCQEKCSRKVRGFDIILRTAAIYVSFFNLFIVCLNLV